MFREYGVDLGELWRARRWRKLLNLIDGLPRNCGYWEAVADDDQVADQWADTPAPAERPHPRVSEWSPEREALADIIDRLGGVLQAVVAAAGVKPKRVPPAVRPETAAMRLRRNRRVEAHRRLVARVLPHHR